VLAPITPATREAALSSAVSGSTCNSTRQTRPCSATQLHRYLEQQGMPHRSTPPIVERALRDSPAVQGQSSPRPKTPPAVTMGGGWSAAEEERLWEELEAVWEGHPSMPSPQELYALLAHSQPECAHDQLFKVACGMLTDIETGGESSRVELAHQIANVPLPPPTAQIDVPSPTHVSPIPWATPNYLANTTATNSQVGKLQKSLTSGFSKSRLYQHKVSSAALVRRGESLRHSAIPTTPVPINGTSNSVLTSTLEGEMHPFTASAIDASRKRRELRNHTSQMKAAVQGGRSGDADPRNDPMVCSASLHTMRRLHSRPTNGQFVPLEVRKQLNKQRM
jgi:hypothetical protein